MNVQLVLIVIAAILLCFSVATTVTLETRPIEFVDDNYLLSVKKEVERVTENKRKAEDNLHADPNNSNLQKELAAKKNELGEAIAKWTRIRDAVINRRKSIYEEAIKKGETAINADRKARSFLPIVDLLTSSIETANRALASNKPQITPIGTPTVAASTNPAARTNEGAVDAAAQPIYEDHRELRKALEAQGYSFQAWNAPTKKPGIVSKVKTAVGIN